MSSFDTMTWHAFLDLLAVASLCAGLFFMILGPIGIHRFPDAFNRIHAASKCTTLGLTFLLFAVCLHVADTVTVSKAIMTIVFTFVAAPVGSHMVAKAAHHAHDTIWEGTLSDELAEDKADAQMAISDEVPLGHGPGPQDEARGAA